MKDGSAKRCDPKGECFENEGCGCASQPSCSGGAGEWDKLACQANGAGELEQLWAFLGEKSSLLF